jgi:hypothetical protein
MSIKKPEAETAAANTGPVCGIIMPISGFGDCSEAHWADVQEILSDSIEAAGFTPNLVSNADDVGIIQKRIIQNLYENPIVVCDVSGKNPNVMFELGVRLAFDKPTIIVKDDKTSYTFDTSPIEHIGYPRDLRFGKIVDFKEELITKIKATYEKSTTDSNYTTFLKHFGAFTVAKLDTREVSKEDYILDELRNLRQVISTSQATRGIGIGRKRLRGKVLCVHESSEKEIQEIVVEVLKHTPFKSSETEPCGKGHYHVLFGPEDIVDRVAALEIAKARNSTSRWLQRD